MKFRDAYGHVIEKIFGEDKERIFEFPARKLIVRFLNDAYELNSEMVQKTVPLKDGKFYQRKLEILNSERKEIQKAKNLLLTEGIGSLFRKYPEMKDIVDQNLKSVVYKAETGDLKKRLIVNTFKWGLPLSFAASLGHYVLESLNKTPEAVNSTNNATIFFGVTAYTFFNNLGDYMTESTKRYILKKLL